MKRFLGLITGAVLLSASVAFADPCAESLGTTFTPQQRIKMCAINGNFTQPTLFEAVAGTGTSQGTGAALASSKFFHQITGANGTLAWVLPAATAFTVGRIHELMNTTAGVANIYPATGGTINGAAANAVFVAPTGIHTISCIQTTATAWICS